MSLQIIDKNQLPQIQTSSVFEGYSFGNYNLSFILVEGSANTGPEMHQHPYPEIFVILQGEAVFTVDGKEVKVNSGQIIIVPQNTPHKFLNESGSTLKQIGIHLSNKIITQWQQI